MPIFAISRTLRRGPASFAGIIVAILIQGSAAVTATELEQPSVTIAVAGLSSDLDKLAYAIALEKGYFRDEGLQVSSIDMFSGSKALHGLVGGSVDIVEGAYEHTLRMQSQGVNLTCIAVFDQYPGIVMMVPKARATVIRTPADLKGRKIGVTSPGSSTHTFAVQLMQSAGLTATDASFVAVGVGASAVAAIRMGGELDALVSIDPAVTELVRAGDVVIMADSRTEEGTHAVYGGTYPLGCLYARREFVQGKPQTSQAVANAIVRAMKWLQTASIDDIVASVPKTYYADAAVYREALARNLAAIKWNGILTSEMPNTVLKSMMLLDPKLKAAAIDTSTTFDNQFAQRALEKYR